MNLLFATQSGGLGMFEALRADLARRLPLGRCGFTVADSWHWLSWTARNPGFEAAGHAVLKEWEVTARRSEPPDLDHLRAFEARVGGAAFSAVVADRRLIMGPRATYTQDYRRRMTDDELLSVLSVGAREVERLFDEVRPDAVLGFICVSVLEYLVHLVARARGVPVLNLRPTRIGNRVTYGSTLEDPSPELAAAYARCLERPSPVRDEALAHVARIRAVSGRYEGVVAPSAAPARRLRLRGNPAAGALRLWRSHRRFRASIAASDNHCPGILGPALWRAVMAPLRARRVDRMLRPGYVRPADLAGRRFAFLPLHTEPEVSLLVYSRPLVNQIEAVRAFALSLPADMLLVVKEHPWMVGKRSPGAYRKLLEIPRVRLAPPETEAREWIRACDLVAVVASSVGLEAAVLGRPVVALGHVPFTLLPDAMVRRCADLTALPRAVAAALEEHRTDEEALAAYVSAVIETSVDVNLYTTLLGRAGDHAEEARGFEEDAARLGAFTAARLAEVVGARPASAA